MAEMPLIAILRGITPDEAVPVAELLFEEGFRIVEIPLNSPDPLKSIEQVARALGTKMVVGAGTVVDVEDVTRVTNIGGKLIVSPNFDSDVVRTAKTAGLYCCPGVQTVTEAFAAHRAGADALKLFPADVSPPAVVKAIRTVLPKEVKLVPVGGVDEQLMGDYWSAGAKGFGIGSNLYKPGKSLGEIRTSARALVAAMRSVVAHDPISPGRPRA